MIDHLLGSILCIFLCSFIFDRLQHSKFWAKVSHGVFVSQRMAVQHMRFALDDFQLWEFVFMESTISAPQRNSEEDVGGLSAFLTV